MTEIIREIYRASLSEDGLSGDGNGGDNDDWRATARYAGLNARSFAAIIDSAVLILPLSYFLQDFFSGFGGAERQQQKDALMDLAKLANTTDSAALLASYSENNDFLSHWLMENAISTTLLGIVTIALWFFFSGTPGKLLMGMKIVDARTGQPPTTKQDIIRYLGYFLGLGIGMLSMLWDKKCRGFHDFLAGTVVVYKKSLPEHLANATRHSWRDTILKRGAE